ncbi:MAG: type I-C CRISPR-associated protein Cas8c/Csd1, partial [Rhodoferax sp.]|nr:type I-C CRISPR-associated protein Cas8c/Csd1 [Rhodoferax sp.]
MILQALYDYYLRRQADVDPARRLPAFGLELKEIGFILEVDDGGQLHAIIDTRQMSGKKKIGTSFLVPKGVKKTSGIAANLLWDNAEYVLALPDAKKM